MSNFELAIGTVLKHEGGYVNDSKDPGGATNFGVSIRYLRTLGDADGDGFDEGDIDKDGDIDADDIKQMTLQDAIFIYKTFWWDKYGYGSFDNQQLATKVFDTSINVGARQCHKFLQRALNAVNGNLRVSVDGILGRQSFAALDKVDQVALLASFRSEQAGFYRIVIAKKPSLGKFSKGWERRAYS